MVLAVLVLLDSEFSTLGSAVLKDHDSNNVELWDRDTDCFRVHSSKAISPVSGAVNVSSKLNELSCRYLTWWFTLTYSRSALKVRVQGHRMKNVPFFGYECSHLIEK